MTAKPAEIKIAETAAEIAAARTLRRQIFVGEQGIPAAHETDGLDDDAIHVIACAGDAVIGTGRLVITAEQVGIIGRVAVVPAHRGKGLATGLMRALEAIACERDLKRLELFPHDYLEKFYAHLGYRTIAGREFRVGTHRVITMEKHLDSAAIPKLADIQRAAKRIEPYIHRTPVLTCRSIDAITGGRIFFKCENFQKVGAFKMRGASNAVAQLLEQGAPTGVATHSSGNHGAALALAARNFGIQAYVVMPESASEIKKRAVAGYGAEIILCGSALEAREQVLAQVVARTKAAVIHPYNDARIIAGQGTAALELLEDINELDIVMAPIGGGGLISGTAIAVKALSPRAQVVGVEPETADDARQSKAAGRIISSGTPRTIADGLLAQLGEKTFAVVKDYVDDIVTVSEEDIIQAMRLIWERMKIVVEPSAAVTLGAVLSGNLDISGKRTGLILSGGNVDLDALPWVR